MCSQKPRIIPWLISQIDSQTARQTYPGLEWINSEKTQFRIPWKHGSKQNRSSDEIKILEAWATVSGCYDPSKDKPDPARWKRNFRSALWQKDGIRMIHNASKDPVNPHKIYEITGEASIYTTTPVEQYASCSVQSSAPNSQQHGGTMPQPVTFSEDLAAMGDNDVHLSLGELQSILDEIDGNIEPCAGQLYNALSVPQVYLDGGLAPHCTDVPYAVYSEVPHATGGATQVGNQVQPQAFQEPWNLKSRLLQHFTPHSLETEFEVNIFYRGTLVKNALVKNPRGFYITSKEQPIPGSYLDQVVLPAPATAVNDHLLVQAIERLLSNLEFGVFIEVREGSICATRLGQCRSYWSMTDAPTTEIPNQISKTKYSVLYGVQQFRTELIEFMEHRRKASPQYNIWICLGEKWPSSDSWKKKYIMVQIIPVVMRLLHEMSYSTGASSLTNSDINLEISDSHNLLSFLRDTEMVWA